MNYPLIEDLQKESMLKGKGQPIPERKWFVQYWLTQRLLHLPSAHREEGPFISMKDAIKAAETIEMNNPKARGILLYSIDEDGAGQTWGMVVYNKTGQRIYTEGQGIEF